MKKVFLFIFAGLVVASCSKDKPTEDKPLVYPEITTSNGVTNVKYLDASVEGTWTYFSFSQAKVVTVADPENDASWDIAFSRMNVKTNGGTSGKSKGEVVNTLLKDFSAVKEAPAEGYVKDQKEKPIVRPGQPERPEISLNTAIRGTVAVPNSTAWISYIPPVGQSTQPSVTITKYVYVVKTANGNFAKIQMNNYYNDKNQSGHITFQYQLSENGKF